MLEIWMKQEIALQRKAGTYFFYGEDASRLEKVVQSFAKALCCQEKEDFFCDLCETCKRIEKGIYSDIHRLESLKIEDIRALESFFYESPYEGNRKIFILPNVQDLKKEGANALLKSIEEPEEGSFFLLWGTRKNILSTIRSRAISVFVPRLRFEELGVSKECYKFFRGQEQDLRQCVEQKLDWQTAKNYKNIQQYLKNFFSSRELQDKIEVYQALQDFLRNKRNLSAAEIIWFVEELCSATSEKQDFLWILQYCLHLEKREEQLEEKLILAKILNFPVNNKVFYANLFFK